MQKIEPTSPLVKRMKTSFKSLNELPIAKKSVHIQQDIPLSNLINAQVYMVDAASPVGNQGGSYKWRGAANMIAHFIRQLQTGEINSFIPVTASAGNHAQGFAYALNHFGKAFPKLNIGKGIIYMPETTPQKKIDGTKKLGGEYIEIKQIGELFSDAKQASEELVKSDPSRYRNIPPYNHELIIAGQGHLGLQIMDFIKKDPSLSKLYRSGDFSKFNFMVPNGGGGLTAAFSELMKYDLPGSNIYAVEPSYANSLTLAMNEGKPVPVPNMKSEYEGIKYATGTSVKEIGDLTFQIIKDNKNVSALTIKPDEYHTMVNWVYGHHGLTLEQSGVAGPAALLNMSKEGVLKKDNIFFYVITGMNIDNRTFQLIQKKG